MNENIKEWIKFIVALFVVTWLISIMTQIIQPRGIIGIKLDKDKKTNCNSKIINIRKDLPADKAKLLINDCVINVDGEDIRTKSYNYASSKIKGKPNTNVNIKISRNNEELEFTIPRVKNKINWFIIFQ